MTVMVGPVAVSDKVALYVIGGAVVLLIGGLWYVKYKAGQVVEAVNPFNNQNVINTSVNNALAPVLGTNRLTGQSNTLGSALYFGVERVRSLL